MWKSQYSNWQNAWLILFYPQLNFEKFRLDTANSKNKIIAVLRKFPLQPLAYILGYTLILESRLLYPWALSPMGKKMPDYLTHQRWGCLDVVIPKYVSQVSKLKYTFSDPSTLERVFSSKFLLGQETKGLGIPGIMQCLFVCIKIN